MAVARICKVIETQYRIHGGETRIVILDGLSYKMAQRAVNKMQDAYTSSYVQLPVGMYALPKYTIDFNLKG